MRYAIVATLFACALSAPPQGAAHHSFAMFDASRSLTLDGTVKEFQWANPHIWIQVMAKDAATSAVTEWSVEGGSPTSLARRGWKRTTFRPGDQVTLTVHPLKNGEHGAALVTATINGTPLNGESERP